MTIMREQEKNLLELRPQDDESHRPTTPFLFIPQDDYDYGLRPIPDSTGWIDCPSIFLVNEKWEIRCTPRIGETYRILALIGNAGAAPVQNGFAEFYLLQAETNGNQYLKQ